MFLILNVRNCCIKTSITVISLVLKLISTLWKDKDHKVFKSPEEMHFKSNGLSCRIIVSISYVGQSLDAGILYGINTYGVNQTILRG